MVDIGQIDFNREMDSYLSKKTNERVITRPQNNQKKELKETPIETVDNVSYDRIREPWYQKMLDRFVGKPSVHKDIDDIDEEMYEETSKNKSIFKRMMSWFASEDYEEEEFTEEVVPLLNEELKRLLKLQHYWIEQLPPEKIIEFKKSPDYDEYKELLKKHGLIK